MYPNLEAELRRRNLKRADLAAQLGCAPSTVVEKMQGKSEFSMKAAKKIKAWLGGELTLEYLFESDTDKREQTAQAV